MSDEAPAEDKPAGPPKAGTPKAILALLVLNLGATGFGVFKLLTAPAAEAAPAHEEHVKPLTSEIEGPVMPFDPFVVNLDEPGTARYLKCSMQFELANVEAEHAMEKSKQLIRDTILSYMSSLHLKDTLGAEGKEHIRKDLMEKIEKIVGPNKVRRMFFVDFVVQ